MIRKHYRLLLAFTASLLLHLSPLLAGLVPDRQAPPPSPLQATLRPPPALPLPPPPPLILPEPPKPAAARPAPPRTPAATPARKPPPATTATTWTQAVGRQFRDLQERGLFYPEDAIARGLEGEVLVLMVIDEGGRVVAARIEQGSGHRLLDDAALQAVRSLRSLPADAPREALLPVRFRLR